MEFDYELMKALLQASEGNLHSLLWAAIKKYYPNNRKWNSRDNYLLVEGELPILLIAHLDTVFQAPPNEIYYDREKQVIISPFGLGADDRAGIYGILKILQAGYRPSILFSHGEEHGCIGTNALVKRYNKCPIKNIHCLIQLDRANEDDVVFYDCDNKKFTQRMESYGFKTQIGSFTDVKVLSKEWGIAGCNFSIGYEREHSNAEILNVDWMLATIEKTMLICADAQDGKLPLYKFVQAKFEPFRYRHFFNQNRKVTCEICMDTVPEKDAILEDTAGLPIWVCEKCYYSFFMV